MGPFFLSFRRFSSCDPAENIKFGQFSVVFGNPIPINRRISPIFHGKFGIARFQIIANANIGGGEYVAVACRVGVLLPMRGWQVP